MKKTLNTDIAIEDLVASICGTDSTLREKHVYREALRGLVRLAKSEQMIEMKESVDRLTGAVAARIARRRAKALLQAQRNPLLAGPRQTQLEFNRD